MTLCRHCQRNKMNRARGLCHGCSLRPEVRALYPSTSKYARRGVSNFNGTGKEPTPTDAKPGTPEKFAVLEQRAANGEWLFHPKDRGHD